jgi:hypothetical protein
VEDWVVYFDDVRNWGLRTFGGWGCHDGQAVVG